MWRWCDSFRCFSFSQKARVSLHYLVYQLIKTSPPPCKIWRFNNLQLTPPNSYSFWSLKYCNDAAPPTFQKALPLLRLPWSCQMLLPLPTWCHLHVPQAQTLGCRPTQRDCRPRQRVHSLATESFEECGWAVDHLILRRRLWWGPLLCSEKLYLPREWTGCGSAPHSHSAEAIQAPPSIVGYWISPLSHWWLDDALLYGIYWLNKIYICFLNMSSSWIDLLLYPWGYSWVQKAFQIAVISVVTTKANREWLLQV